MESTDDRRNKELATLIEQRRRIELVERLERQAAELRGQLSLATASKLSPLGLRLRSRGA
jgi:hypothetical protein